MFATNYARIESRHPTLDLMRMSLRKVLNITYEWLMEAYQFDQEGWERDWADVFRTEPKEFDFAAHADGRLG